MADHQADHNTRIVLAARPQGEPTADDFRLEHAPVPEPASVGLAGIAAIGLLARRRRGR